MRERKLMLLLAVMVLLSISCILTQGSSAQDRLTGDEEIELRSVEEQTQDAATAMVATETAESRPTETSPAAEEPQDTEPTIPPKTQTAFALYDQGYFTDEAGDGLDCETGEYSDAEIPFSSIRRGYRGIKP